MADLIQHYPPYHPAVAKPWDKVTEAEAVANFDRLMTVKAARLARYGELLAAFGLDLEAGLAAPDPKPFLDALWRWTAEQWPTIRDPALADLVVWLNGERRDSPVFGLITDTGLALGESVVRRRPDFAWALNLDPTDRVMKSWRRPCMIRPSDGIVPTLVYDPEAAARSGYANCQGATFRMMNELAAGALDFISDAHERFWREGAARLGRSLLPDLEPDDVHDT